MPSLHWRSRGPSWEWCSLYHRAWKCRLMVKGLDGLGKLSSQTRPPPPPCSPALLLFCFMAYVVSCSSLPSPGLSSPNNTNTNTTCH
eukprot:5955453-Prorocentrum_lima.AAC.1